MDIIRRITEKKAQVGVIGMGYVGLPLAVHFLRAGFAVTGFDTDPEKAAKLNRGESYIKHIPSEALTSCNSRFSATSDFSRLAGMAAIIICVPTPLTAHREPDTGYIIKAAGSIAKYLAPGTLVSLESTTYPGTTEELVLPALEKGGRQAGRDFFLVYSPERENPGDPSFSVRNIPKVVGGVTPECLRVGRALYSQVVKKVFPVSSCRVAEASKLLENIYRAVNIALVNELKMLFDRMGIDVWEVIEASSTKPFGFQPFYPGPGLGGHCIPIDPFYLTWKAREYDFNTRFIELAGEINTLMPYYVLEKTGMALNRAGKSLCNARVLVLGVAYKPDVDDPRESPGLKIMKLLRERGARVSYNDPHVPRIPRMREYGSEFSRLTSRKITAKLLSGMDAVLIATRHSSYDYDFIVAHAPLVIDTRNACPGDRPGVVKA